MAIFPAYREPKASINIDTDIKKKSITIPSVSACKPIYDNQAQIDSLNSILANYNMLKAANSFVQCDQKFIDQVTTALKNAIANGNIIGNTCESSTPQPNSISISLPVLPIKANISITNTVNPPVDPGKPVACRNAALRDYSNNLDGIIRRLANGDLTESQAQTLQKEALNQCNNSCGGIDCSAIKVINYGNGKYMIYQAPQNV